LRPHRQDVSQTTRTCMDYAKLGRARYCQFLRVFLAGADLQTQFMTYHGYCFLSRSSVLGSVSHLIIIRPSKVTCTTHTLQVTVLGPENSLSRSLHIAHIHPSSTRRYTTKNRLQAYITQYVHHTSSRCLVRDISSCTSCPDRNARSRKFILGTCSRLQDSMRQHLRQDHRLLRRPAARDCTERRMRRNDGPMRICGPSSRTHCLHSNRDMAS
jgi:hypothetical protein